MAKTFKDVLDNTKLFQIATDARNLLCEMEHSMNWTVAMEKGIERYTSNHSKLECLAFKAALHFHIFWTMGEYIFETVLIPVSTLVEKICNCDTSVENYQFKIFSMAWMFRICVLCPIAPLQYVIHIAGVF